MTKPQDVTQEEIRKQTGKCYYCWQNEVKWFCPDCWFGVCDDCLGDERKCHGDCYDKLSDLGDIEIFDHAQRRYKKNPQ